MPRTGTGRGSAPVGWETTFGPGRRRIPALRRVPRNPLSPTATAVTATTPLGDVPARLADDPALAQVRGRGRAHAGRARAGPAIACGWPTWPAGTDADPGRRAHHRRRRAPGPRPGRLPRSRRGRAVPGVGDAAVRAGQPRRSRRWAAGCARCGACATPTGRPRVVVAPVRALVQRLGPARRGRRADRRRRRASSVDRDELVERLVGAGYRREYQVEHRGEVAVRGSIVDVFPSTADVPGAHRPVGRRGRPAHRVLGQPTSARPTTSTAVEIFPCRELLPTDEVRARAERARRPPSRGAASSGSGWPRARPSTAWSRGCRGSPTDEHVLFDLLARRRAGPAGRAPAHARPGRRHPRRGGRPRRARWPRPGARRRRRRRLPAPAPAVRPAAGPHRRAGVDGHHRARGPRRRHGRRRRAGTRWSATASALVAPARASCSPTATAIVVARRRRGLGRAPHCGRTLARRRATASTARRHRRRRRSSGAASSRRSSWRCWPRPTSPAAAAPTARPGPASRDAAGLLRRPQARRLRRAPPARRRPATAAWSSGPSAASSATTCCSSTGATTSSTSRPTRSTPCATTPAARRPTPQPAGRRRLAEDQGQGARRGQRDRPGAGGALPEARAHARATPSPPDTPWQRELEEAFPYQETPDQLQGHRRREGRHGGRAPDGPPGVRRRRLRQDRGGHPGRVQGGAGRQAGGGARAHHAAGPAALPDLQRPLRRLPGAGRGAQSASSPPARPSEVVEGVRAGEVDVVIGTHRLLSEDIKFKDLGLLVVDEEQRFGVTHKEQIKQLKADVDVLTLTATPIPRTLEMSLTGIRDLTLLNTPPAERQPILTYVGEYDDRAVGRGHPPRAAARGPGLLRAQPGAGHRADGRPRSASSCPRPASPSPTARWTRARSSRSCSTSGRASTTCSSAPRSSSRASTCRR